MLSLYSNNTIENFQPMGANIILPMLDKIESRKYQALADRALTLFFEKNKLMKIVIDVLVAIILQ